MKFKKIISILLLLLLFFTLSGCSSGGVYKQADQQYLVSAIAFKKSGNKINAFAETVIVNTESTRQGVGRHIFSASGDTAKESLLNLTGKISKPLLFDHCGLVAVDTALNEEQLKEIIAYCRENEEINLAAYMVSSEDTEKLFDCEPVSTLTVGYDLMGVIDRVENLNGIKFHNRYYEVCANRLRAGECYLLPEVSVKNGEYILNGADIYIGNKKAYSLDITDAALYCLITDNFKDGSFNEYKISSSKTYFECDFKEERLHITLNIKANIKNGDSSKLYNEISRTLDTLRGGSDVFGFKDRILRENRKVWNKIKDDYTAYYNNAEIEVKYEF